MIAAFRQLFVSALLLAILLRPEPAPAQSTSSIQGTITDASGSVIPNAKVIARNTGTSEERTTATDATGSYAIPALTPGTYRVQAQAAGMQTVSIENLPLEVGQTSVQNLTMGVAGTSEVVQITAQAPVLESTTMTVGEVVNYRTVQEIPLNGRHFVDLGVLIPGSVTPPANGFLTSPLRGQGGASFNTAGNREDTVNFMINGINLNDMSNGQITFQPSISTVQEFKVDNSSYSAEFGRNSGAIVNIATRSGTNGFHGEAFEFVRNDYFDARNYFNRKGVQQSPFKRNQFGADGGGPIFKNRTFFFVSYEALRQRQGITINQTVLSDAQRAQAAALGNPTVLKLLPLIPQPNTPGNKFVGSATAPVNIDQGTANISHEFSAQDRINGYFVLQHDLRQEPTLQLNNVPGFGDTRESRRQIFTLNETHVFSPNIVNEARLGYNRIHIVFTPNAQLNPVDFGINNSVTTAIGLPQINLRDIGLNFGGPAGFPQGRGVYTAVLSDTLTYLRGKHSFKFGGEYRRFNGNNFGGDTGVFTFDTVDTFLRGQAAVFTVTPGFTPSRVFVNALGVFAQDSYKIRPNLTLEFGLRYEWNGTPTEAQNRFVVFDPVADSLIRVGSGLDRVYKQNARNFEPRAGFAWDVWKQGKTIVRGGYGLLTDQPLANAVGGLSANPPFSTPVSLTNVTFANAFTGTGTLNAVSPVTVNRDFRNPYIQSWNLNVQQQITNSIGVMAGYFGSKGTHLRLYRNINQPLPNGARPYPALSANSPILPGRSLTNINMIDSGGNSSYNALWLTANKRFSKGLQFNSSYTLSKSIDYNSLNTNAVVVQESANIRESRGLSDFDARHRFVVSGIYALPFSGNRIVEGWQVSTIVQLQTGNPLNIVTSNTTLTGGGASVVRPDVLGSIPTGFFPAGNGNIQYFPSLACTTPTPGCLFVAANHFGNLGRNVIIGPGFQNIDFSLQKNTRITEHTNLQFRADFFDLLNHPNFGNPNRTVSTAAGNTFGQISSTRFPVGDSGSSRQIQLAMKFIF